MADGRAVVLPGIETGFAGLCRCRRRHPGDGRIIPAVLPPPAHLTPTIGEGAGAGTWLFATASDCKLVTEAFDGALI
eukprot:2087272-Pleurochrysis_carterae.AAC.2